ncbi:MAG: MerR family DNA-binding transcriptional regulator [Paenibacillus sp.]|uniref:MerR family DNA-binding transcriptional regulator n=1 Tax=Paenibacillus sp. TaxID=58172 RepID=UPI002905FB20|nr:MerR family DNA-binding transcriptional regulator [Paenibacillus sp.]MDU4694436.1 MerR family DNA-binding transcriptional regulator [Paenibacillus sp.]
MEESYTPAQIAEQLNVSTTTLRRYEEQGLIPEVLRTDSNHRIYTKVHYQAFIAIRSLLAGYEIPLVYEAMRKIRQGNVTEALWLINHQLYRVQEEKQRVEELLTRVRQADFRTYKNRKLTDAMTIGNVAELAGVNPSAIRHWEKEGLITSTRHPVSGYRIYSVPELRKILVISTLRKTIYYIENLRELLQDLETFQLSKMDRSFQVALEKLNQKLTIQYQGIAELMAYIQCLG